MGTRESFFLCLSATGSICSTLRSGVQRKRNQGHSRLLRDENCLGSGWTPRAPLIAWNSPRGACCPRPLAVGLSINNGCSLGRPVEGASLQRTLIIPLLIEKQVPAGSVEI